MEVATYTVKKGDTLTSIAKAKGTTVANLVKWNDIEDPNYIVVGQVLKLGDDSSSSSKKSTSSTVKIKAFGLQSNTDRTVYASWTWTKSNTENYKILWQYYTGDGVWFNGEDSSVTVKQSAYTAPSNAIKVRFKVKPISKKHKVNNKETSYWTANWSSYSSYAFSSNPPTAPSTPSVEIEKFKLTATLNNLDVNATSIQFQVVKNDSSVFNTGMSTIKTTSASYSCTVDAGGKYKVRARAYRSKDDEYSDWSDYSSNLETIPAATEGIIWIRALSEASVQLKWERVSNATSFEVEYTTDKRYFNSSTEVKSMTSTSPEYAEITGLESGQEYFFRVRAVNEQGSSSWCEVKSIVIGKDPSAPTTWSSTTTCIVGEELILYWVHNSEDGSSQTTAELELTIGGSTETKTITNTTDEDEKDKTSSYVINTSSYTEGIDIQWRVRTAGITKVYGDWSVQRTVNIYAPPTISIGMTDQSGNSISTLTSFPFYVSGETGPNTQRPIGYHLSITSNEKYETVDEIGNLKMVNVDEELYSKYLDTNEQLFVEFSANNIDLENNIEYKITCTVSMNSGLTSVDSRTFNVSWLEEMYEPNAEIGYNEETFSTYIRPYCEDENEELIEGVILSVYRREFDGTFTPLATSLENSGTVFITDPHPALDYARYRIVATSVSTGSVSYYDAPGYPTGEKAVIIQWNESWSYFDTNAEDKLSQPPWAGSLLRLPYNIDVSDENNPDVSLVEYIGRSHPVSYYGTQRGSTSTWNVDIDKEDEETLYALRRLQNWMGDVYVREPSGSGYWANITVSFNQKHCELTIPVTLKITRVEGGA